MIIPSMSDLNISSHLSNGILVRTLYISTAYIEQYGNNVNYNITYRHIKISVHSIKMSSIQCGLLDIQSKSITFVKAD